MVDLDQRAQDKAQRIVRLVRVLDYNRSARDHAGIETTYDIVIEMLVQRLAVIGVGVNSAVPPSRPSFHSLLKEEQTQQLVLELHMALERAAEEFPRTWFQAVLGKAKAWLSERGVE